MDSLTTAAVGVGLILGFRHAFEPDHVAAVTLLAGQRAPLLRALGLGAMWAVGHSVVIGLAGFGMLAVGLRLLPALQRAAELMVALVLVAMGVNVVASWWRGRWHLHGHDHGGGAHVHLHSHSIGASHAHAHVHPGPAPALGIGVLHGLAGSGAALTLWMASAASQSQGVAWFAAFSVGTTAGMLAVSAALWTGMRLATAHGVAWVAVLRLASAAAAIIVGGGLAARVLGER